MGQFFFRSLLAALLLLASLSLAAAIYFCFGVGDFSLILLNTLFIAFLTDSRLMMNPFLVQSPHREPEPEPEPEPQSQSETCAIKVSDKDQEKADDNSLSLTSTPTTEATATTTAVTTTTDPIDSFQVWNIMPNQSRSGVVTWSTDDGNILLRMTFHPKDKVSFCV
jgi:hypothetical protein